MKPPRESKEARFRRLAEARVNKIISMIRLLGNLSCTNIYSFTKDQVDQIFTVLQMELIKAKVRFLKAQKAGKKRFSLNEPYETEDFVIQLDEPVIMIPLPDGTFLRAVGYPNNDYPAINIYWDNGTNSLTDALCFVEFNPEKDGEQKVCIGAYWEEKEDTTYYQPYITAERNHDE